MLIIPTLAVPTLKWKINTYQWYNLSFIVVFDNRRLNQLILLSYWSLYWDQVNLKCNRTYQKDQTLDAILVIRGDHYEFHLHIWLFLMENHKTIFYVSYDVFQLTEDETNIAGFYRVQTCCASLLCKLFIFVLYKTTFITEDALKTLTKNGLIARSKSVSKIKENCVTWSLRNSNLLTQIFDANGNQSRETKQKHIIFQLVNAEKSIIMKSIEYSNNKVVI